MIYYALSTLRRAGSRDILISTTVDRKTLFRGLLRGGSSDLPMHSSLVANSSVPARWRLVLGDDIFHGHGLPELLARAGSTRPMQPCSAIMPVVGDMGFIGAHQPDHCELSSLRSK